ncbi:hypothetical protein [Rhodococcus sp. ARC_M8]|uniref:hypothetical protein n=1 Tax=Rhodococcus sp. ARC_M8 TaxID=2928853 RepID=UPI001FB27AFC|nr:hypothetical protein [Rhodococcus sp. ARC_M8]
MPDTSQGTSCPDEVSTVAASCVARPAPEVVWKLLSPLLAARQSMRLAEPDGGGKFNSPRPRTSRLPDYPAAVPIYDRQRRTKLLALDFDAKIHGAAQVDADVEHVLSWLHECGARTATDRSTSGGRHVLVPLAAGTSLEVDDFTTLLTLLESRLPTFDKTPMRNATHGCITVPGSLCKEGGHRQLVGTLADAVDAFTLRSDRGVVARMVELLGGITTSRPRTRVAAVQASLTRDAHLVGVDDTRRLHPRFCQTSPIPAAVAAFARAGEFDRGRWDSPSEARQSVITALVRRGATAADIESLIGSDEYAGLRQAYDRYKNSAQIARSLRLDVNKALTWAASVATEFRVREHKNKHTGGYGGIDLLREDPIRRRWLASANTWIDQEFLASRQRPALLAVVQSLAYSSALAGNLVEGVPVVAIGGRGLSHAAGLMSEASVWSALRVLRETPGSPVLRVARGAGQLPDRYALTTPVTARDPSAVALERAQVAPVHHAWSVLGLRSRVLYDLIHTGHALTVKDAFAAAKLNTSAGYSALTDLRIAGLITRTRGAVAATERTLDDVADDAGLDLVASQRVVRHRAERLVWHAWLESRSGTTSPDCGGALQLACEVTGWADPHSDARDSELIWAATLAAGPPTLDPDLELFDLLRNQLRAVIAAPS